MVGENCQMLQNVILADFWKSKAQSKRLRNSIKSRDLVILVDHCILKQVLGRVTLKLNWFLSSCPEKH